MKTLSSDQENPSIPPDAVRCLARISFAKVKYGLESDVVRMNLSDDSGETDGFSFLFRQRNLIPSTPVCVQVLRSYVCF